MRDVIVLAVLVVTVVWTLRAPWIGAMAWTVTSIASPHMYWGYAAASWPVAMVVALSTLTGMLFSKERINPFQFPVVVVYVILFSWMTIGLPFSFVPDYCYDKWDRTMKISLMLIVSVALIDTWKKLQVFIWANAMSVGLYGIKGGVFTILTAGSSTVLGPGGFIAENNALALANAMVVPLFHYLSQLAQNKWLKRGLVLSMALISLAALGSNSRGALLAMIAMGGYFWIKSRQKAVWGVYILLVVILVLALMPASYWDRMNTIKTYDQDDSAQGRINSWWAAFNIANSKFFGGGFTTNISWVYEIYAPNPKMLFVEHSIYFQMLGEFGWVGLLLFLSLGVMTWRNAQRLIALGRDHEELAWAKHLGSSIQVSMVAFGVAGAFLSMALFDLPYNVMVISALALRCANQQLKAAGRTDGSTTPAGRLPTAIAGRPSRTHP